MYKCTVETKQGVPELPRSTMYPEGSTHMNAMVPTTVKRGVQVVARKRRQSVSQVVTVILEDYLKERGELPKPERAKVAAGA